MHMAFYRLRAAMIGALGRNRGVEAVLEQCGGPPDSKGSAYGGGRSARAREGAFKRNLRGREGVNEKKSLWSVALAPTAP